ncbi:MAG: thioredoxin-dependent thiol peroxidase [Nitrososphaeria archaeon]|nr:thioredoxin-dependent thiol peroxidase [Nitrososphaeria archaeon]NDB52423.1 thioredoxin-dependent thiol peroxidase [Nitrosopumilaceae archaeon]NDB87391.1 thioredoxin-dependent thiol peroxidase [Nitrososphaerota archaeon]NDB47210.1 thioredoxin-dependent thiol peroxidase [Nitrososphaeria archaeon]NDB63815.1 thioredoxin-dependent thiol peroxidase [Nitrosopumilaceae archaeon]
MLEEGDKVPSFELQDADGKLVKSSEFKGKKFVVYFYPRDFTPGCTIEADEFSKEYKKFQKIGVTVIGISTDSVESHKKFVDKMGIPYVLLSDPESEVSKKFGVWGKKQFMGKEYMGIQRSTFLIDEKGKIFKVYPSVKPKGHAEEVLAILKN